MIKELKFGPSSSSSDYDSSQESEVESPERSEPVDKTQWIKVEHANEVHRIYCPKLDSLQEFIDQVALRFPQIQR